MWESGQSITGQAVLEELLAGQRRLEASVAKLLQRLEAAPPTQAPNTPSRLSNVPARPPRLSLDTSVRVSSSFTDEVSTPPKTWLATVKPRATEEYLSGMDSLLHRKSTDHFFLSPDADGERPGLLILHPWGTVRAVFDAASCLVVFLEAVGLPLVLAWGVPIDGPLRLWETGSCAFWALEFLINFCTGFVDVGVVIMRPAAVWKHYLRSWCALDLMLLLASITAMLLDRWSAREGFRSWPAASRWLRLLPMLRIMCCSEKASRLKDKHLHAFASALGGMPWLVLGLIYLNHVLACGWYGISAMQSTSDTNRWIDMPAAVDGLPFSQLGMAYQYTTSYHWSLCQMTPGSLPVDARNLSERLFTIGCLLLGMVFFSSVVSALSQQVAQLSSTYKARRRAMKALDAWLHDFKINEKLAVTARIYAREHFQRSRSRAGSTKKALEILPPAVQHTLCFQRFRQHLAHPIFRWWELAELPILEEVCYKFLDVRCVGGQEQVFRKGTAATGMLFLTSGRLSYKHTSASTGGRSMTTVETGTPVAEAGLWVRWSFVGTATARTPCEVLDVDGAVVGIQHSRLSGAVLGSYSFAFCEHLRTAADPTDLEVLGADFPCLLPVLPNSVRGIVGRCFLHSKASTMDSEDISDLQSDLIGGRCSVMLDEEGSVVHLESWAVLKLSRSDGRVLHKIAEKIGGADHWQCKVELPQVPAAAGPRQALDIMMESQLVPLVAVTKIDAGYTCSRQDHQREHCGVRSERIDFSFTGSVDALEVQLGVALELPAARFAGLSLAFADAFAAEVCPDQDEDEGEGEGEARRLAFAWLAEDELQQIASRAGPDALAEHLASALAAAGAAAGADGDTDSDVSALQL